MKTMRKLVKHNTNENGSALMLAVVVVTLMLMFSLVGSALAINSMKASTFGAKYYGALAAAEAGLDDYLQRMKEIDNYWSLDDPSNPALRGWTPIPGDNTGAEFKYNVDTVETLASGLVKLTVSGKQGGQVRTLTVSLRKRSTIDYAYFSDYETADPYLPGAYQDLSTAKTLCESRYWWKDGVNGGKFTAPTTGGNRNSRYCIYRSTSTGEVIRGNAHSNDAFYFNGSPTILGRVTSSCPDVKCPKNHRYVEPGTAGSSNNTGVGTMGPTGTAVPTANAAEISASQSSPTYKPQLFNPYYDGMLDLPASNSTLKKQAEEGGCLFTGPTRILFKNNGTAEVTSPDTIVTRDQCGGINLYAGSDPLRQRTVTITTTPSPGVFNGVIYVQDLPSDPADENYTDQASAPSCVDKEPGNPKPYVIPRNESSKFNPKGGNYGGFPSAEDTSPTTPIAWFSCSKGDGYIQGALKGQITLATENTVFLTGHTRYADTPTTLAINNPDYGRPLPTSKNILGLVANSYVTHYNPVNYNNTADANYGNSATSYGSRCRCRVTDWNPYNTNNTNTQALYSDLTQQNAIYNFALLAVGHSFTTMNFSYGGDGLAFFAWGSVGHRYRSPMGDSGAGTSNHTGYDKRYNYDERLSILSPPFMLDLTTAPWKVVKIGEVTPQR